MWPKKTLISTEAVHWNMMKLTGLMRSILLTAGQEDAVRSTALVPVPVNYRPLSDSRLISMILIIHFPGEPKIIIAFRANPISQPLILNKSFFYCASSLQIHVCKPTRLKKVTAHRLAGRSRGMWYLEVRQTWWRKPGGKNVSCCRNEPQIKPQIRNLKIYTCLSLTTSFWLIFWTKLFFWI